MLVCTVAAAAQLAGAIVLARSVKEHHPYARFVLCLVECHLPPKVAAPFDDIVVVGNNGYAYASSESLAAAKAFLLTRLLGDYDTIAPREGETIVYLDPDSRLYAPLSELAGLTRERPVLAVPFRLEPESQGRDGREIERLRRGYLHAGFLTLRKSGHARMFMAWWLAHIEQSLYGPGREPYAADKWLSVGMVPHRLALLRRPSYHAAAWNIDEPRRCVTIDDWGGYRVHGEPLHTFCFADAAGLLGERRADPAIHKLVTGYEQELEQAGQQLD